MIGKSGKISLIIFAAALVLAPIAVNIHCDIPVEKIKEKYAIPESRYMKLQGMQVHYADEGKGFPLVLIHGTSSSLHTWDGWTRKLKKDFRIIRMDIPAYGITGPNRTNDYSPSSYVAFLKEFLDRLGIRKCHIAGNSLGGGIAWSFTAAYPDMISRLILIDSAGYFRHTSPPLVFRITRAPVIGALTRYLTPRYFVKKSLLEVYGDDSKVTDELIDRYHDMALREGNRDAFIARAKMTNVNPYETANIKTISVPVLIMWGSADTWIAPEYARRFRNDLKNSRLIMYEGIGHVPMEEIPEKTAGDAGKFLRGV